MKINQLKIGVVLSYVSMAASTVISIVYTPVMLRLLGQSEYGLYSLSSSVVSYLSLLSLGFGSAYIRYYSKYNKNDDQISVAKLNALFLTVFTILAGIALLAGIVLVLNTDLVLGGKLTEAELAKSQILMSFMVVNIVLTFINSVFDSYVTAHEQYFFQRILKLITTVLNPFLVLPLLLMGYKSISLTLVSTSLTLISLLININYCKKKLHMQFNFQNIDFGLLKEIGYFSFFIFINMIVDQINWSVDKFILGKYLGTTAVAVYSVGSQINTYYLNFSTSISSVFIPRVNRLVVEGDKQKEITELFTKVGRIQFMILWLIFINFTFYGQYFISVWAGEGYNVSYYVTLLLIGPVTIPLIQNLGIEIQRAMNMHQFRSIVYLFIAISNVFISIILCQSWGEIGVALGTAISLLLGNGLIMNIYYHKMMKIDIIYFWHNILKFVPGIFISICLSLVIKFVIHGDNFLTFVLGLLITSLLTILGYWFLGMNDYEKGLVKKFLNKFRRSA